MQNYPISPRPLDQHSAVHIRVCIVCTGDEFALDPLPSIRSDVHRIKAPRRRKTVIVPDFFIGMSTKRQSSPILTR